MDSVYNVYQYTDRKKNKNDIAFYDIMQYISYDII